MIQHFMPILDEYQRGPWWGAITSAPFKALGWVISLFKDKEEEGVAAKTDPFRLTKDEAAIATALSKRISVSVDKKTGVTTLSVTMQDPLISASLTDTVMRCLQNYITDYRTNKARHDFSFLQRSSIRRLKIIILLRSQSMHLLLMLIKI
mgnify:CR=1 FL=1